MNGKWRKNSLKYNKMGKKVEKKSAGKWNEKTEKKWRKNRSGQNWGKRVGEILNGMDSLMVMEKGGKQVLTSFSARVYTFYLSNSVKGSTIPN